MITPVKTPIFVTGAPRSGTTWLGKILSKSSAIGYIHEPFNLDINRPGICNIQPPYWHTYVTTENEEDYYESIKSTINFQYHLRDEINLAESPKDILRIIRDYSIFSKYKVLGSRPLVKDPLAVFSAEWFANRFLSTNVVLIRHPAAFVGSIKKQGWKFHFTHLLDQPLLIRDYLFPFEKEIADYAAQERDTIDQASLMWKLIHLVISKFKDKNPDWIYLKHEDLSKDPLLEFKSLFEKLGLDFSNKIESYILEYCTSKKSNEAPDGVLHYLKRDSRSNILNWKKRLSNDEICRIRRNVEDISHLFYEAHEW
jgi:hypothetical protein